MNHRAIQVGIGLVLLTGVLTLLGSLSSLPGSALMGGIGVVLVIYGYISYWIIGEYMEYTPSS